MRQKNFTLLLLAGATLVTLGSCKKELFDKEIYEGAVAYNFLVDNCDPEHDWCLTKGDTITIKTPENSIYSVQVLTADPYTSTDAEIAAEGITYVWDGSQAELAYTLPITQSQAYIAALDNNGNYIGVKPFTFGTKEIELRYAELQSRGTLTQPAYQTFTYLYESNFPMPGDFDYNDMVLRISKRTPSLNNSTVVDLTVTLEAVGAEELYAAAIQLDGIRYDDISSVELVDSEPLDKDYPLQRLFITNGSTLLRGRKGEAVLNLTESAQWAMSKQKDELGDIPVIRYNTTSVSADFYSAKADPVSITYRIVFKDRSVARLFTFDRIDPFILHQSSNGGIWEVHTYAHKHDATLWESNTAAYTNAVSWALIIPKGDFRYPLETLSLSTYNEELGGVYGPYDDFADWMRDHSVKRDWYLRLTRPQLVY